MSTATPESTSTSPDGLAVSPLLTRLPLVWLGVVMLLAVGLRAAKLSEPLNREEFAALYTVAERTPATPDAPPTAADPLRPVAGLGEVSARSVLPFGVRNPVPLYHDILYFTVKALPIAEWSLRLPSLLAGLGCIVAIYFLCRRLVGVEMALVAALFVAVEPMQVSLSALATQVALANLACILSFAALLGVLRASKPARGALPAAGYAACVALIGYLNPVLLLVIVAHVALLIYWAVAHRGSGGRVALAAAGIVVAALLLVPAWGYVAQLQSFAYQHRDQMPRFYPMELRGFLLHNGTFLVGLLVAALGGLVVRYQLQSASEESAADADGDATAPAKPAEPDPILAYAAAKGDAPAADALADAKTAAPAPVEPPPPEYPDMVWTGRLWIFLPQLVAMVLAYAIAEPIFFSRFLSYTTLGGLLVLAYWVTRGPTHQGRLGVAAAVAASLYVMSFLTWGHGHSLTVASFTKQIVAGFDNLKTAEAGDTILLRSNQIESDYLYADVAPEDRRHLAGALAAPLTTLYVPQKPLRVVVLSFSENSEIPMTPAQGANVPARAGGGEQFDPQRFYTPELAARLRSSPGQFWIVNDGVGQWREWLTAFLPWLAKEVGADLKVAKQRTGENEHHYFTVPAATRPKQAIEGLSDSKPGEFGRSIQIVRVQRLPAASQ